jgi:hypothetical protein
MNVIEAILDRLLKKRVIANCEHDPYLHRWYLVRTKAFGIFISNYSRIPRSTRSGALHRTDGIRTKHTTLHESGGINHGRPSTQLPCQRWGNNSHSLMEIKQLWITTPIPHALGDTIHVMTETSRRKARIIATKPNAILIQYQE